ncbi:MULTISPECIES: septal ring lytic transglycosylase RlpA family protein [unclassified Campylobacter]|uniref:septal ring lytic transglycosylase RlpA family protein n=1 Tax=unclassified Campylobacter TaxID=2593542 RepID=UPI0022E9E30B|nr:MULTISPECIES: septal ring lytic transglycosylase RlpA family protein [unclassified Campylobacter]MDA3062486.1 septal ring lytic transglycosylase RlpA family protein [Campylobacter sp. JMF_14 EL1]MDA3073396.1 septal ring lytic transglycosylase RlpA family protein [Campylobacter sp. JMF_10 EL2]MDA3077595.1 septal ring lytic transglycosylase RlpA family protein [Campylobacter sp. JMF_06 NA1]
MHFKKSIIFSALVALIFAGCFSSHRNYPSSSPSSGSKAPKIGKNSPATMRPYKINGKTYYPEQVSIGDTQSGIASWYGPGFNGKKTSNGEIYDMNAMTAAHKTYPMNTMVKVTNRDTGASATVRINDRGPFVSGRVIDLSKSAANKVGVFAKGTAPVKLEVVGFYGQTIKKGAPNATIVGGNFMVQIGAFRNQSGAARFTRENDALHGYPSVMREFDLDGAPIYRVFLSGFKSESEARDFIASGSLQNAFFVRE